MADKYEYKRTSDNKWYVCPDLTQCRKLKNSGIALAVRKKDNQTNTNKPKVDVRSFKKREDTNYIAFKIKLLGWKFKLGDLKKCDSLKSSEYDKKYFYIDEGPYKGCYYKKKKSSSGGSTVTPTPVTTSPGSGGAYTDCTGESRKRGCKDTDGLIKKVQACIGVVPDGKFGPKTEAKLKEKTGKSSFESNEVEGICSGKITPEGGVFGPEQQKEYWTKLKTDGQIYEGGIAKKLSNAQKYVYIIKRKKDGTKVPMSSEAEVSATTDAEKQKLIKSFDEFDYEVLYPIEPSAKVKRGEVGILTAGIDQNDKVFVKIMKDSRGFWEPAEVEEKFEMETPETLAERVIKKVLKLRLFEQKVNRTISSSSDPKKDYTYKEPDVTQSTTTTTTTTTTKPEEKPGGITTDIKIDEKKIKDDLVVSVFKERRRRVLEILKTEIEEGDAYSSELVEPYKVLLNISPETYCDPQNIKTLNNSLVKIEKRKAFVFGETKDALLEVERILKTIETDCGRIEQKVQSEVKRLKAEKTKTTSSSTQPSGGKPSDTKPSDSKPSGVTDEKPQDVIDPEVKSFVEEMGFTFEKPTLSEKDRLATRTTVGEQLRNLDTDGIYREYYMDRTPIWKGFESESMTTDIKSTLSTIKTNIPEEQKKSACRKAINQLFVAAFPPAKVRERETRQVIEDDMILDQLKTAVIRCDEEHNFPDNRGGDEIQSLYECRNNDDKRSYYGISRYCLKDFRPLKQDNPMMQRESIIRRHIVGAIKNKKQEVMVESIIRKIKNLR